MTFIILKCHFSVFLRLNSSFCRIATLFRYLSGFFIKKLVKHESTKLMPCLLSCSWASPFFHGIRVYHRFIKWLSAHHKLNGSSSPVLTATSLSYEKAKNSTPHRIKTPDPIEIKFGTVDFVGEMTPHAKFYANPSKGAFPANGWNIRKNFCSYILFFRNSPTGQTLRRIFAYNGLNDADSRKDVHFGN